MVVLAAVSSPHYTHSQTPQQQEIPRSAEDTDAPETNNSPDWVRPQDRPAEPWPGREHDLLHIQRLSVRGSLTDQKNALHMLSRHIEADRVRASDVEVMRLLEHMVLTGIRSARINPANPADSTHARAIVRVQAVQLIASVGGPETEPVLSELLSKEQSSLVLSYGVAAAREIGKAPGPELESQLTAVAKRNNNVMHDEALARELIQTIEQYYIRYGYTVQPEMFREILRMAREAMTLSTRRQAAEAIRTLRGIPE
ncbi:MAG: hypothetical protein LC641_05895 [Spirochaeta sp.]|nr:hypothetical protein [Spirochaeta sp.]